MNTPESMQFHATAALESLRTQGYAQLTPAQIMALTGASQADLHALACFWNNLPPDAHLKDGGRYRFRRHASYVQTFSAQASVTTSATTLATTLEQQPHRAHWQPTDYNALHGGIERWFDPIEPSMASKPSWNGLLQGFGALFSQLAALAKPGQSQPISKWFIEAHPFRIDTKDGVGRPTPEGAHRDGVDFVVVLLVQRHQVKGGETRVFQADGPNGVRFTMAEPWTALLLDDAKVIHETTPIQPMREQPGGVRDTLVLTYRRNGFQDPV
jgi:hypothetical protein